MCSPKWSGDSCHIQENDHKKVLSQTLGRLCLALSVPLALYLRCSALERANATAYEWFIRFPVLVRETGSVVYAFAMRAGKFIVCRNVYWWHTHVAKSVDRLSPANFVHSFRTKQFSIVGAVCMCPLLFAAQRSSTFLCVPISIGVFIPKYKALGGGSADTIFADI